MNVVALAGGVGGAKLVDGLSQAILPENLTIIVNTGDDFEHLGLKICPDLDTVCYTLAGLANPETGWGRAGETWNTLESLAEIGGPTWFRLGDKDLATHLERTRRLHDGQSLSQVTRWFCQLWGIKPKIIPMSDDPIPTWVFTDEGDIPFQDYFVRRRCQPRVKGFRFQGVECSRSAPGVMDALASGDLIIICPSNPWVSIDPILAIPGVKAALTFESESRRVVVAVSPIIGGEVVKGPAAKMFTELGVQPSALAVARHYGAQKAGGLLTGFVLDNIDADQASPIVNMGMGTLVTDTIMRTPGDRFHLAEEVLAFGEKLSNGRQ
jgi:LPPG:FO 2-phospho-L-lactate transferase